MMDEAARWSITRDRDTGMAKDSSEQGDIIASYDGWMLRQVLLGRFGLGSWDQVPLRGGRWNSQVWA